MGTHEEMEEIKSFQNGIKGAERKKSIILASIPAGVIMIMWIIIIIANSIALSARSADKFDLKVSDLSYIPATQFDVDFIQFHLELQNNSDFEFHHMDITLRFYDTGNDQTIGYFSTTINEIGNIQPKELKQYTGALKELTFGEKEYAYLKTVDLSKVATEVKINEVWFGDGEQLDYNNSSWFGFGYIILLAVSVAILVGWTVHIFTNTYCNACRSILAIKNVGRREIGRKNTSWNEKKEIKTKQGEVVLTYDERVQGEEIEYQYKRVCKYCGNVTYRQGTERHKT